MKNRYFQHYALAFLVAAPFSFVSAQSLELQNLPGVTTGTPDISEYVIPLHVKNISANTINVIAKRESQNLAAGHVSYFCWEECYTPAVTMGTPVSATAGEVIDLFKSYIEPDGNPGISTVTYSFYNADDITDSVQYTFVYELTVSGISHLSAYVGSPYPNPSSDFVNVNLNLPDGIKPTVEIVNVIGRTVKSVNAVSGKEMVMLNVANLAPGVYFIRTIANNDTIKVQKFTKL